MVTLIKYGALSGGEKYNVNVLSIDGLSTDTKPTVTYIEYGSDGREVGRMGIPNGSLYTEIDTGDTYMYDADNMTWYQVTIGGGGGGGGGFTPTTAQLDAMNSGINSTKVAQITTNENNILLKANSSDVNVATANLQGQIDYIDYTISDLSSEGTMFEPCLTPERTTANTKIFAYNDVLTAGKYKISIVTADDVKIYLFSKVDSTNLSLIRDYTITPVTGIAELEFYCGSDFVIGFQGVIGFAFGNGYVFLDVNKNGDSYTYTQGGNTIRFDLTITRKEKKNIQTYYGIPYIFGTNSELKIKLLGDSLTQGSGSTGYVEWNDGTNTYRGNGPDYPNKWEGYVVGDYLGHSGTLYWYEATSGSGWGQLLKTYYEDKFNVSVKDYGMGGATVYDILIRLSDLVSSDDDIVTIMIGTNDRKSRSLSDFTSTLDNLVARLVAMRKEVILISPSPLSVTAEASSTYFHAEDINNALSYIAYKYNLKFISCFDELLKFAEYRDINVDTFLNSDGVHPNDTGYAQMFNIISRGLGIGVKRNGANW